MDTYTETITKEISIDLAQIWQEQVGDYFSGSAYWVQAVRFFTKGHTWEAKEWDASNKVAVIYYDEEDQPRHTWLQAQDFAKARVALYKQDFTHCGHYGISLDQGDDSEDDACVNDAILQQAIFGKQVFG